MAVSGERNCCPFCRTSLWASASERWSRKRCPRCAAELWVVAFSDLAMFFVRQPGETSHEFLASLAALVWPEDGFSDSDVKAALSSMDSLDLLEFIFEVEKAMHCRQPEPGSPG
jgi:hypothetical protein